MDSGYHFFGLLDSNIVHIKSYPLLFVNGNKENDSTCHNITVIDNMVTENLKYFTAYITSNDSRLQLFAPTNATVWIEDSDCEYIYSEVISQIFQLFRN